MASHAALTVYDDPNLFSQLRFISEFEFAEYAPGSLVAYSGFCCLEVFGGVFSNSSSMPRLSAMLVIAPFAERTKSRRRGV